MTLQTIHAVYENGIFRVLSPRQVKLEEGQAVRLTVEEEPVLPQMLREAVSVFDGLSEDEINEIERIALARDSFFPVRSAGE